MLTIYNLELYESEFFKIRKFVTFNSGTLEDAQDVFQEGIVVLLEKLREPGFKFSCAVGTYLYSCCKNIWLKEIRRRRLSANQSYHELFDEGKVEIVVEDKTFNEERLEKILSQLSESCLKLIKAFYYELKPWIQISKELNYSSEGSAKNQKYKCLKGIVV